MFVRDWISASSDTFLSVSALLRTRPMTMLAGSLENWRRNSYWNHNQGRSGNLLRTGKSRGDGDLHQCLGSRQ